MLRRIRTLALHATAALAALAALGCGDDAPAVEPLPDPLEYALDEDGPFLAGYRTITTSYDSPADGTKRELTIHLWYPTREETDETPLYALLFSDPDVEAGATLLDPAYADGYPLVVHSHGRRAYGGNSAHVARHFATHGWIFAAPDHRHDTLVNPTEPLPTSIYAHRPLDVSATLDALAGLPADDPLAGRVVTDRALLTGHSFGTYTTWVSAGASLDLAAIDTMCTDGELEAGCTADELAALEADFREPRVVATVPMAGNGKKSFIGTGYGDASIPLLMLTGGDDDVGAAELFADAPDSLDLTWVDVAGGCHQLFGTGDCPQIDNATGLPIVNAFALAFGRTHVLSDPSADTAALLDGSAPISPLVTFDAK